MDCHGLRMELVFLVICISLLRQVSSYSDEPNNTLDPLESPNENDFEEPASTNTRFSKSYTTVKFYSFPNKANPKERVEIIMGNVTSLQKSGLVPGTKVTFLIHGFADNVDSFLEPCYVLVPAYLQKNIHNIICVDWGELSASKIPFPISLAFYIMTLLKNVPKVGLRITEFVMFLKGNNIISGPGMVHLVGTSLGAHVAGVAGLKLRKLTGQSVARISGLDPAGPFLEFVPEAGRIDKTDATFVDVIHTDSTFFGSQLSLGHVDFFANGGRGEDQQPGCLIPLIAGLGFTAFACGHPFGTMYYMRTIKGEMFTGCKCIKSKFQFFKQTCAKPKDLSCKVPGLFGEFGSETVRGNYYLDVPSSPKP